MVIDGKRNLSRDSALRFSKVLGHNKGEHAFFEDLVFFNQADTTEEKNHYFQRLWKYPKATLVQRMERKQFKIFSQWYVAVISQMVELKDFQPDPTWIASKITPSISREEARKALDLLLETELIVEENGTYRKKEAALFTGKEVRNVHVRTHHQQMIQLGKESIDNLTSEEREISSLTLAATDEQFEWIKEHIVAFRKEIMDHIVGEGQADVVCQVNFQLFPLVKRQNG